MPSLTELAEFINRVGMPVALVVAGIYFAWRVGKFVAPLIRDHSSKHLEFVDSVKESNTKQTGILEMMQKTLDVIVDTLMGSGPRGGK